MIRNARATTGKDVVDLVPNVLELSLGLRFRALRGLRGHRRLWACVDDRSLTAEEPFHPLTHRGDLLFGARFGFFLGHLSGPRELRLKLAVGAPFTPQRLCASVGDLDRRAVPLELELADPVVEGCKKQEHYYDGAHTPYEEADPADVMRRLEADGKRN